MRTIIPELSEEEIETLRTAPHRIWAWTNVAPGAPGYHIQNLLRFGYLEVVARELTRDFAAPYVDVLDLTDAGRAILEKSDAHNAHTAENA